MNMQNHSVVDAARRLVVAVQPPRPLQVGKGIPMPVEAERQLWAFERLAQISERLRSQTFSRSRDGMTAAIAEAEALPDTQVEPIERNAHKLTEAATITVVGGELAKLIASFPNAGKTDLSVYGAQLTEDIGSLQPSAMAVQAACRRLRRNCEFLPTISVIFQAIEAQVQQCGMLHAAVAQYRERLSQAKEQLQVENDRHQREREELKAWYERDLAQRMAKVLNHPEIFDVPDDLMAVAEQSLRSNADLIGTQTRLVVALRHRRKQL